MSCAVPGKNTDRRAAGQKELATWRHKTSGSTSSGLTEAQGRLREPFAIWAKWWLLFLLLIGRTTALETPRGEKSPCVCVYLWNHPSPTPCSLLALRIREDPGERWPQGVTRTPRVNHSTALPSSSGPTAPPGAGWEGEGGGWEWL